jgi:roadblock/LC7 domain-containing protein
MNLLRLCVCALAALVFTQPCYAEVLYEPAVVQLDGVLRTGKFRHPNGEWVKYYVLKLDKPVSVAADKVNAVNVSESGVNEVQAASTTPAVEKTLKAAVNKHVVLEGTLFHGHTAWHIRKLVMLVSATH